MNPPVPPRRSGLFRSVVWLSASNVVAKPLWFLFITAGCIRVLGAAEYGTLTAAMALAGMTVAFSELGTGDYLTREGARGRQAVGPLFTNILAGRLGIGLLALATALGVGSSALGYVDTEAAALLGAGLYALGFRLNELCKAVYRGFEVFTHEAASLLVERILVIASGVAGLLVWRSAAGALGGMALGAAISLLLNVWWIHVRLSPLHPESLDLGRIRAAYVAALPLGAFGLFAAFLLLTGPVVIEATLGNRQAGLYGAGYKVIEMLMLVPMIVGTPLLPRLSRLYHEGDHRAFRDLTVRSVLLLGAAAVGIAAVVAVAASPIVALLAGRAEFAGTVPVLRVLAWAYPCMVVAMLMCTALIASDRQHTVAWLMGAAAAVNLLLNVALVPRFGVLAAAAVLLGTQALVAALSTWTWARSPFGATAESALLPNPPASAPT